MDMAGYVDEVKKMEAQAKKCKIRPAIAFLRLTLASTLMQRDDLRRNRDELREVIYRLKFENGEDR